MQRCSLPLTPFLPPGGRTSGHTSVGVRCEGDTPWTLFVPALVRRAQDLVVAARPIARGTTLSAADLTTVTRLLPSAPAGVLESPDFALGRVAMRDIAAGTTLNANQLKAPQLVRRGQAVTLSLASGPVAVRVAGTALKDGTLGERIPVRNVNSKRVVEGVILADGVVEVAAVRP
ncbi:MAG: flagellar basal body P-ring formation chaperone FlgA [Gammaproteobacteria bacterium]